VPEAALVVAVSQAVLDRAEQFADHGERRRLAARRRADQRLPEHQRLRPGRDDAGHQAGAADRGHRREQALRDVVDRGAGRLRRLLGPAAPVRRQYVQGKIWHAAAHVLEQDGVDLGPAGIGSWKRSWPLGGCISVSIAGLLWFEDEEFGASTGLLQPRAGTSPGSAVAYVVN
jgi:hypothetical protein